MVIHLLPFLFLNIYECVLGIGENILDDTVAKFSVEKEEAIKAGQRAVVEKLKRKFEKEIVRRLEQCKTQYEQRYQSTLQVDTEDRIKEEVAKHEALLQTQMSENLRNLQNRMSQEMEIALEYSLVLTLL